MAVAPRGSPARDRTHSRNLWTWRRDAGRETGRFGIRVNVIEPGWVRTPLTETFPEDVRQRALDETILGELVEPEDVAAAVVFLSGDASRRITGQILRVDAGQYL